VAVVGRLAGKVAIVVGAGQTPGATIGNGRATALRFAQEGARLFLVDRRLDSARETARLIEEAGGAATCFEADVTREENCAALVAACVDRYGRVDILHNNVGIGRGDAGPTQIAEAAWDVIHSTNLKSVVFTCKHALPVMRAQRGGVIVNISSIAAVCSVGIIAYKTSKAALNAYTQSLAIGNGRYNIRANVIMPGLMNTPMAIEGYVAAGRDREALVAERNAQVPLNAQMGSGWDVANAALFLASDEARFITGVCLAVDGGQSARIG
jgi:NAD(P)-dependent dehydrogenase (short-subunit alcohol dehydrogenase family)